MTTYKEVFQLAQDKGCRLHSYQMKGARAGEIYPANAVWCLALIQKWLRDEYGVYVQVTPANTVSVFQRKEDRKSEWVHIDGIHPTYEQALIEGIPEALKLI